MSAIQIVIPRGFVSERTYIIDILFRQFLGVDIQISFADRIQDYKIGLPNGNSLVIRDHFFNGFNDWYEYLNEKNIPANIERVNSPFTVEADLPAIYGTGELVVSPNEIICGVDIFASSFFMLSRWEEYANKTRDGHNRFPAAASLAFKYGFLDRPIVNEYVEMLWNMLVALNLEADRKVRRFELINTHDVDHICHWKNFRRTSKLFLGDIVKRRNISLLLDHTRNYVMTARNKINDPYDTFDFLMDQSENLNMKSRFYFMSGGLTSFDNSYRINDPVALRTMNNIRSRGHIIGFHPSYDSFNNGAQWNAEKIALEKTFNCKVAEGRQHFLRFEAPTTWQLWEDNGMTSDLTLGYADREGFRCGVCYEYPVFNFLTRKKLNVLEYPLIVMEASLINYQIVSSQAMNDKIRELMDVVRKYEGNFVFLWHNSSFWGQLWDEYSWVYSNALEHSYRYS